MFVNYEKSEINAKLFYFGSAGAGKLTNIKYIYRRLNPEIRGKLNEMSGDGMKTLSFDFLPANLGDIGGFKVRFQVYAVSGGDAPADTLRTILKNTDGIVFIIDSRKKMFEKNKECEKKLESALGSMKKTLKDLPCAIQYNKRDLPDIVDLEELYKAFNRKGMPFYQAVASDGKNVMETLTAICRLTIKRLKERFQRSGMKELGDKPKRRAQDVSSVIPDNYTDEALKMVDDLDVLLQSDSTQKKPAAPTVTLKLPEPSRFDDSFMGEEGPGPPSMEFDLSELTEEGLKTPPSVPPVGEKAPPSAPAKKPAGETAAGTESEFDLNEIIDELEEEGEIGRAPAAGPEPGPPAAVKAEAETRETTPAQEPAAPPEGALEIEEFGGFLEEENAPVAAEELLSEKTAPDTESEFDLDGIIDELDEDQQIGMASEPVPLPEPVQKPVEKPVPPAVAGVKPQPAKADLAKELTVDVSAASFSGGLLEIPVKINVSGSEKIVRLRIKLELGEVKDV